ncbi:hypothetical protein K440DRAFT_638304 [Wilcoxina mikolae CBS 423.85]|nr:hypothetical protein K440DRAFT_638304 [Wilcoxina mikolae CBS 423.85]
MPKWPLSRWVDLLGFGKFGMLVNATAVQKLANHAFSSYCRIGSLSRIFESYSWYNSGGRTGSVTDPGASGRRGINRANLERSLKSHDNYNGCSSKWTFIGLHTVTPTSYLAPGVNLLYSPRGQVGIWVDAVDQLANEKNWRMGQSTLISSLKLKS